jgi:hypothetical protein
MISFDHLHPDTAAVMTRPRDERLDFILRDKWVPHPIAQAALDKLDQLVAYPRSIRMPSRLVVGRPNNGKSTIMQQFASRHPVLIGDDGMAKVPVICVETPSDCGESELWSAVLWAIGISHREKELAHIKKRQVKTVLRNMGTKVLAFDEFNNLINAGKETSIILAALKEISNELHISIAAAGTQLAINAIRSEPQMDTRFDYIILERWGLDEKYRSFVATYEELLPLAHPSDLAGIEILPLIWDMAGDTVGAVVNLLKKAAEAAIISGEERITPGLMKKLDWVKPEDRARQVNRA